MGRKTQKADESLWEVDDALWNTPTADESSRRNTKASQTADESRRRNTPTADESRRRNTKASQTADEPADDDSEATWKFRRLKANTMLLEAKAKREQLNVENDAIELDKQKGNLCYNDVALAEFSRVLKLVYDNIKRLPETLNQDAKLTPEQTAVVSEHVEQLLVALSNVRVELSTTAEIDRKTGSIVSHVSKKQARAMIK